MRAFILANGDPPPAQLAARLAQAADIVLATDGAANKAAALGIAPGYISGDFDSIRMEEARAAFPLATFLHTPDQDRADLEKAIEAVLELGATEITVAGAFGGRVDHSLAAIMLLLRFHRQGDICLCDERATVRAISGSGMEPRRHTLATREGDTVSLLSLDPTARVSIKGVRWPLNRYLLPIGTQGVSNVALGHSVEIEVSDGRVIVCHLATGREL